MTADEFYTSWCQLDADLQPSFWRNARQSGITRHDLVDGVGDNISLPRVKAVWPRLQRRLESAFESVQAIREAIATETFATAIVEPLSNVPQQEPITVSAKKPKKRGRPKNAPAKLPIHDVPEWEALEAACLDILWRKPGMLISKLVEHLALPDGNVKKAYALIHQSKQIEFRASGRTKLGKPLERLYPPEKQAGWYVVDKQGHGRLWGLRELARLSKVNRNALRFRLRKGWTVKDAVSKPSGYLPGVDNENAP